MTIDGKRYVDESTDRLIQILNGCQPGSADWIGASSELQRQSLVILAESANTTEKYTRRLVWLTVMLTVLTAILLYFTIQLAAIENHPGNNPQPDATGNTKQPAGDPVSNNPKH